MSCSRQVCKLQLCWNVRGRHTKAEDVLVERVGVEGGADDDLHRRTGAEFAVELPGGDVAQESIETAHERYGLFVYGWVRVLGLLLLWLLLGAVEREDPFFKKNRLGVVWEVDSDSSWCRRRRAGRLGEEHECLGRRWSEVGHHQHHAHTQLQWPIWRQLST